MDKPDWWSMNYQWHDLLGNIGVVLMVGMYLFLQMGRIESSSYKYSIFNAIGAFLVVISLMYEFNMSAFIVEGFWVLISLYGILRVWRLRRSKST